jgi:KaiC/GvpD/RAD55 family RecA-like ATPase
MTETNELKTSGGFPWPIPLGQLQSEAEMDWHWYGYLAPGCVTLLTGRWKSGKTTLLSYFLRETIDGGTLATPVRANHAIIVSEESPGMWRRRRDELGLADNVGVYARLIKGQLPWEDWERLVDSLAEIVRSSEYRIVVFDNWATFNPAGDENDSMATKRALLPLHRICEEGASVLLIHHPRKGAAEFGQLSRGSGALPAFADILIEFSELHPEHRTDTRRVLKGVSRYDETPAEIVLELTDDGYHTDGSRSDVKQTDRLRVVCRSTRSGYRACVRQGVWPSCRPADVQRKWSALREYQYGFNTGQLIL